jgi:UPF0042 nucleotide-binding protein
MSSTSDMKHPSIASADRDRIVLVTGPAGAGRSSAINALEDLGYEAIDNIPLSLLQRLLHGPAHRAPLALGVDTRNRDFSTQALLDTIAELSDSETNARAASFEVLYLDCSEDVLLRRFSETRRRHPMSPDEDPRRGVMRERGVLAAVRDRADVLIDTSALGPNELRTEIIRLFSASEEGRLAVSVHSFSYKRGLPRSVDTVFDCRFLRNPHWEADLRALCGLDGAVVDYVRADENYEAFVEKVVAMTTLLLPAYKEAGKAHFSIGFGCTGGQHRSVAVTEHVARSLAQVGWQVSCRHRELERMAHSRVGHSAPKTDQR